MGAWSLPHLGSLGGCQVLCSQEDPAPSANKGSGSEEVELMPKDPVARRDPEIRAQGPILPRAYLMMLQVGSRRVTVGSWV